MSTGWAATNTLRMLSNDPPQEEWDAALALVEAALDAAEKYRSYFAHDNLRGTHHALQCDLAAALRAVREGR